VAIDPRGADLERDDEALRSGLRMQVQGSQPSVDEDRITLGGHLEQGSTLAPLQGTKVVITNLETSVSQEDIMELCEDVGPLKRAKLVSPGHAEVFFVNHSHAKKAMDIYHNRLMDGKPMRCQLVGANSMGGVGGHTMKLPPSVYMRRREGEEPRGPRPDLDAIHQALFRKNTGKKPTFTVTLAKKCKDDPEDL
jgi:RNA recognition motif-containing protein